MAAREATEALLARLAPALAAYVVDRQGEDWSPEQITGTLTKHHPGGSAMRVSHETIYKTLFVESRGVLAPELRAHLRSGRPMRRSVHNTTAGQWRSQIKGAVSIRERPLDYSASTAQGHADRAARRPKAAKLATHAGLRQYVQDRLAVVLATPGGRAVPGPTVTWKGRRHGRRQHRRWSRAWSPEQIALRLPLDFPDDPTMRISH